MANALADIHSLEGNYIYASARLNSQSEKGSNEAFHLHNYMRRIISHIADIHKQNPELSEAEIKTILLKELDDYSIVVFENAYVFDAYLDYYSCEYLSLHGDKYKELDEALKASNKDYSNVQYQDCTQFDEYLTIYIYRLKEQLYKFVFDGLTDQFPPTSDNIKHFDELLEDNKELVARDLFSNEFGIEEVADVILSDNSMSNKHTMIKKLGNYLVKPSDRTDLINYANVFLHGPYSFISFDKENLIKDLRSDLAKSTNKIVNSLDSLGHLDSYIADFVFEMCRMKYPEFARIVCKDGFPDQKFIDSFTAASDNLHLAESRYNLAKKFSSENEAEALANMKNENSRLHSFKRDIYDHVDKEKLKAALSENLLNSSKTISLESLLALNSFWSNRYAKELDTYTESLYAAYKFDLINKIINNEHIDLSVEDLNNALVQMNTFYRPASNFLARMQHEVDIKDENDPKFVDEGKFFRYSYEPFVKSCIKDFNPKAYEKTFNKVFPGVKHDLASDADLYVRLYNPIFSSYLMKNEMINALLLSMDSPEFANAGIILSDYNGNSLESSDGTSAKVPFFPIIGFDAGLSFPVRIHSKKPILIDFLKSINGNAIMPIYEGYEDFNTPYGKGKPISASLIIPVNDKVKKLFKNGINATTIEGNSSYHPNAHFVSHLAFTSPKRAPSHLLSVISTKSGGKPKHGFTRRYIDLETNQILVKVNDVLVPVEPKEDVKNSDKGAPAHDE